MTVFSDNTLGPVYRSMRLIQTPLKAKFMALGLIAALLVLGLALMFVPWQQSVSGAGEVTVFSPMSRPQTVNALIEGRIKRWRVQEGDEVVAGQPLLEMEEVKSEYLDPQLLPRLQATLTAYQAKKSATQAALSAFGGQVQSLSASQGLAVPVAQAKYRQSQSKQVSARQKWQAARQVLKTAELNYTRRKTLLDEGLGSAREFELAELDYRKAQNDALGAEADVQAAAAEQENLNLEVGKTAVDATAKVQDGMSKQAKAQQDLATVESDILALQVKIASLEGRVGQRIITAPVAGRVVRLYALGAAETVKAGEKLATIVPQTKDQAVALYLNDIDAPLVAIGSPVRLQFAGWPALQFSGWPQAALGTFAGQIAAIDAVADEANRYRILVVPDFDLIKAKKQPAWPSPQYLRPGAQVTGWVMLNQVPLGYELWRRFNAFPPSLQQPPKASKLPQLKTNSGK